MKFFCRSRVQIDNFRLLKNLSFFSKVMVLPIWSQSKLDLFVLNINFLKVVVCPFFAYIISFGEAVIASYSPSSNKQLRHQYFTEACLNTRFLCTSCTVEDCILSKVRDITYLPSPLQLFEVLQTLSQIILSDKLDVVLILLRFSLHF